VSSIRLFKPLVFAACLLPLAYLLLGAFGVAGVDLGTNPVEELLHELGRWGLKFLLLTLAVTPVRRWFGWPWVIRYRRMLGLFAFFYLLLHFLVYAVLDQGLAMQMILEDIVKRPYITLGMAALLLMVPLAATSTKAMMRKMGKRWKTLHRLVYVIAILAVWHFYWQVKLDTFQPLVYAAILAVLLAARLRLRKRR
jgi:sulfoxide reductase heme-binding subunit YedZ